MLAKFLFLTAEDTEDAKVGMNEVKTLMPK
jgi:hypothetical protein